VDEYVQVVGGAMFCKLRYLCYTGSPRSA
jgi:hypothetical protein